MKKKIDVIVGKNLSSMTSNNSWNCQGVQCGIRQSLNARNTFHNNTNNNPGSNNNLKNNNQQVSPAYERYQNQQQIKDNRMTGDFKSILDKINKSSLNNPSGIDSAPTSTRENTSSKTELQSQTSHVEELVAKQKDTMEYHEDKKPSIEHQTIVISVNKEFVDAQKELLQNNSEAYLKPSMIRKFINNTKEPLTPQENNFKNSNAINTDISHTEPLAVPVTSVFDSDIIQIPLLPPLFLYGNTYSSNDITLKLPEGLMQEITENYIKRQGDKEQQLAKLKVLDTLTDKQSKKNEEHHYEICLNQIRKHIKFYETLPNIKTWTEDKKILLKEIKSLIKEFTNLKKMLPLPLNRDIEEFIKIKVLIKDKDNPWVIPVLNLLKNESIKEALTLQQYTQEQNFYKETLAILMKYGDKLPLIVFHELIRRVGVIVNNDAIYKDDSGNTVIVKEGEGSSFT